MQIYPPVQQEGCSSRDQHVPRTGKDTPLCQARREHQAPPEPPTSPAHPPAPCHSKHKELQKHGQL